MKDSFALTIAICTRNRQRDLAACLKSLAGQQDVSEEAVEIVIVDDTMKPARIITVALIMIQ